MSEYPLRPFGRSRNRAGYASLNTDDDDDGDGESPTDRRMPLNIRAAVAAASSSHSARRKGKSRRRYADSQDEEEEAVLLGDDHLDVDSPPLHPPPKKSEKSKHDKSRTIPFRPSEKFKKQFPPNIVRNQKYNAFTFLPIVFYEQFKFFFNLYFLLVALSQFIPALKIGFIATYIAPLAFVLCVTIGKEAYDDYKRNLRDREANSQKYLVLDPSSLSPHNLNPSSPHPLNNPSHPTHSLPPTHLLPSSALHLGDLLLLEKNDRIPADLLLLKTSDESGTCYVRTDQLDGETDWKVRVAVCQDVGRRGGVSGGEHGDNKGGQGREGDNKGGHRGGGDRQESGGGEGWLDTMGVRELMMLDAEVYAEAPSKDIHTFIGTLTINSPPPPPLSSLTDSNSTTLPPNTSSDFALTRVTSHPNDPPNPSHSSLSLPHPSHSSHSNPSLSNASLTNSLNPTNPTSPTHPIKQQPSTIPLTATNMLWANTVLAAGSAIGLVVYTGPETRAVMNTSHPETKVGLLDLEVNRLAKILCAVTFALSLLLVALNGFRGEWYVYIFRFLILFSSIIPISLRVNLDMGKTVYASQIMSDPEIPNTIVRTSTLPEELGRIEYLLSDKTGTLTQNEMEMRKLHMGTVSYGYDSMDEVTHQLAMAFNALQAQAQGGGAGEQGYGHARQGSMATGMQLASRGRRDMSSRVHDVVLSLALCHNVTPVTNDDGTITYQASSPDEVAIVKWTQSVGLTLIERSRTHITLLTPSSTPSSLTLTQQTNSLKKSSIAHATNTLNFEILELFPFTSESKRMGIIVRDMQSGEIMFLQKGADVVMTKIVQRNDWLEEETGNMAREGLRTLVMARKRLSPSTYASFKSAYHQASILLENRNEAMEKVVEEYLEKELELLGLTGVEDKLQDDVRGTIELLRNAGVKIWMLTGDKVETATCIAVSTKLVARNQYIHQVAKLKTADEVRDQLEFLQNKLDCCLVIDGESLQLCLNLFKLEFIEIATKLSSVVACRCSPTQKADVARLIRSYTKKRVCCIGDGGNDVSMIQAADVGVGIVGKEGKQASLAADFSVTQFSHLTKLLLWHGRNSYRRSAKLAQFVIHRGLIISIMQAVFSAIFYFAPIALYQGWLMAGYATVYTMAPVFSLVLDRDVSEDLALLYPELYKDLVKGRVLSYKTFFMWLMISLYQGAAIMIMSLVLFENEFLNIVAISFTALILNELIMVALEITTWHIYMVISEIVTLCIYMISMAFLPEYFDLTFVLSPRFAWKVAVIVAISAFPLYIIKLIRSRIAPAASSKLI